MKNLKLFQIQIRQEIEHASDKERVLFGLDVSKRLLSEYKIFAEQSNSSDIRVLDESIYAFENFVRYYTLNLDNTLTLINKVDLIKLDIDNFSTAEASCALNALTSIYELLLYLGDKDNNHIFTISTLMTKTIEFKILDDNDQISYEEVDNHSMLNSEFRYQIDLLKTVPNRSV